MTISLNDRIYWHNVYFESHCKLGLASVENVHIFCQVGTDIRNLTFNLYIVSQKNDQTSITHHMICKAAIKCPETAP